VYIKEFLSILEEKLGRKAIVENRPMQDTDVYTTYADTRALEQLTGYHPQTDIADGLGKFSDWFLQYHAQAHQKRA
jgi:UDP-glucuronate 4-epimerase